MEAKEFRIGNLVTDEKGERILRVSKIVDETSDKEVRAWELNGAFGITLERMRGIPLTEEWLLKFWFEKKYFTDGSEYLEIDKTDYNKLGNPIHSNNEFWKCYRFQLFKNEWYFGIYKDPKSNQFFVQKQIQFVHQLQNIYFALTGDELTIK